MATQTAVQSVDKKPFYGWAIWLAATVGLIATSPAMDFSLALFNDHLIEDIGISRSTLSGMFGAATFIAAMSLTRIGRWIDRQGSRKIGTGVLLGFALVMGAFALVTGPLMLFMLFVALRLSGQGGLMLVSNTVLSKWWERRRGGVMAWMWIATAIVQGYYLQFLQWLIDSFGWRETWAILGLMLAVIVLPLWWLLVRDTPESLGMAPDGDLVLTGAARESADLLDAESSWTLVEARRRPIFWVFISGRMMAAGVGSGLMFHQVSVFEAGGYDAATVAQTFSVMMLVRAVATLMIGRVIQRIRPGFVMAAQNLMQAIVLFLAMTLATDWMLTAYAFAFGIVIALGTMFDSTVWADLFGRLHHGAIRGFLMTALVIGTSIGPFLYGLSYDLTGSYDAMFIFGISILIVQFFVTFTVKRPCPRNA